MASGLTVSRRAAIALSACGLLSPPARAVQAALGCRSLAFEGGAYTVCPVDLRRFRLKLFLLGQDGQPYASLPNLARDPSASGLVMATNAGMYDPDLRPVGLYVEDGRELKGINRANGPGNFHLKPNGVFFVAGGRAGILETSAYLKKSPRAQIATQSGPMLVIDGAIHPRFSEEGPSRKIRNGVGVRDPDHVVFAISDGPVSFGTFARLFRDELGCRNALFLDGSISALYAPEIGRSDVGFKPLGPLLGVVPKSGRS